MAPQPEPHDFDVRVRQPGNKALLKGKLPAHWTRCLPELEDAYDGVCAYLSMAITPGTGSRTVDHFHPKKHYRPQAYEWTNCRLACGRMNGRKGDYQDVVDPFTLAPNSFTLEFADMTVAPAPHLAAAARVAVTATIARLQLNCPECCRARESLFDYVMRGWIGFDYLANASPFMAHEWTRQGHAVP